MKKFFLLLFIGFIFDHNVSADLIETEIGTVENFGDYVSKVWNWAAGVIFGVAVATLIIGGLLLMSSAGDEERANAGKQTIKGAISSIVIVLFSAVIHKFIQRPTESIDGVAQLSDTKEVISNTIGLLLSLVGTVAVMGLIISGIRYMTSGGDEEKLQSAKNAIKMSIIGLIISISAYGILGFILRIWK